MRTVRIALASYQQESNSLSPLPALRESFEDAGYGADPAVLARLSGSAEWLGALTAAREDGAAVPVPVWAAHAVSGGPVPAAFHAQTVAALLERLERAHRAAPLDGILLILHGATLAAGCHDVAGATLQAVRERFSDSMPLVATLDLHANVTPAMVEAADVLVPYHTYPHVDLEDTGTRGVRALLRLARGAARPHAALRRLPLLVPPENAVTDGAAGALAGERRSPPLVEVMARALAWEAATESVGLFPVQPWLNVCDLATSVLVYGGDARTVVAAADELAGALWARRAAFFDFPMLPPAEAVAAALAATTGPVILSDAADSTGSGATGDSTAILAALLAAGDCRPAFVSVVDPGVAALCHERGAGGELEVAVGGKLDPGRHTPVVLRGVIQWAGDGYFRCEGPQWQGKPLRGGRAACIRAGREGAVHVVVTERPCFVWDPGFYRMAWLDVRDAQVVVVKSAGAYRAAFAGIAADSISVDGPGASPSNLHRIEAELSGVPRPLYPFDPDCAWPPA